MDIIPVEYNILSPIAPGLWTTLKSLGFTQVIIFPQSDGFGTHTAYAFHNGSDRTFDYYDPKYGRVFISKGKLSGITPLGSTKPISFHKIAQEYAQQYYRSMVGINGNSQTNKTPLINW